MYEAVKVKFDPTQKQKRVLESHCGGARFAYNSVLNYIEESYRNNMPVDINFYDLRKWWNHNKSELAPWWKDNNKECYANSIANLAQAYKNYFDGVKGRRKDNPGKPKYKKRLSNRSFTVSSGYFDVKDKRIRISKIGKIHCFENIEKRINDCKMKSCTISFDGDNWYASILVETEYINFDRHKEDFIGIDIGIKELATLSDGTLFDNNKYLSKKEKKLKRYQRILSRKQGFRKGEKKSKRYLKTAKQIRKQHRKIKDQRRDNIEKITTDICKTYKNISIEDLKVKNMQKNHKLAKSLSDASLSMFRSCLERKAQKYGNNIYIIDTYYPSSKTYSNCGQVKAKLDLSERVYICDDCGTKIDRDLNAAINLQKVAQSAQETINACGENVRLISLKEIKQISMKRESGNLNGIRPEALVGNNKIHKII